MKRRDLAEFFLIGLLVTSFFAGCYVGVKNVKAEVVNYVPLASWGLYETGSTYWMYEGYPWYWSGAEWDTDTLHTGNPSIQLLAYYDAGETYPWYNREINRWYSEGYPDLIVEAGDVITFGGWIKTGVNTTTPEGGHTGARFGFDFAYEVTDDVWERVDGAAYEMDGEVPDYTPDSELTDAWFVPMNSDWTYRETTFTIPTGEWGTCTTQITAMGVWFHVSTGWMNPEMGDVWFSDTFLYINGEEVFDDSEFSDDFETGDLSLWDNSYTSSGTVEVQTAEVYAGTYSMLANVSAVAGAYAFSEVAINSTDFMYYSSYVKFLTALPADGQQYLISTFSNSTGGGIASIRLYSNSTATVWRTGFLSGSSETGSDNSSLTVSLDTWYHIEFVVSVDGSAGYVSSWIDGVLIQNYTGLDNNNRGNVAMIRVGEVYSTGARAHLTYVDDVAVTDYYVGVPYYDIDLVLFSPQNTTYTDSSILISVSNNGNDTETITWNLYLNGVALYDYYQEYTGAFNYTAVSGSYNFTAYAFGDHGENDTVSVMFTVDLTSDPVEYSASTGWMATVLLFVLIFTTIGTLFVGGWLLPLVFGSLDLTIGAIALQYSSVMLFSPYLQLLLVLTGALSMLIAGNKYRSGV